MRNSGVKACDFTKKCLWGLVVKNRASDMKNNVRNNGNKFCCGVGYASQLWPSGGFLGRRLGAHWASRREGGIVQTTKASWAEKCWQRQLQVNPGIGVANER